MSMSATSLMWVLMCNRKPCRSAQLRFASGETFFHEANETFEH